MESGCCGLTAGTAHEYLPFVFTVKIDKQFAGHEAGLQAMCTGQSGLLVTGEQTFYGAMLNVIRVKDGQLDGITDAVVSTQSGAFGFQPVTVDIGLYGICVEVEIEVYKLFAHHIHVALENHRFAVLVSRSSRLANEHVTYFVDKGFQVM